MPGHRNTPVLRLRSTVPTELILPRQRIRQPDGPWIAHPDLIDERMSTSRRTTEFPPDITMREYRDLWKARYAVALEQLKTMDIQDANLGSVIELRPFIHMQRIQGKTNREIASAIESQYVGAHHYLKPGQFMPPQMVDRFGDEWGMNARGIYYRHHYSSGWVTADHSLWLPSLHGENWDDDAEKPRRIRARSFLKHAVDNEKWNKSEYAWEVDAWTDVFGLMRNDQAVSVDKHEYNTIGQKTHDVSCLLTGESKYIKRVPDATFGLATFQPEDYHNAVAEWDLDRDRLEALLLHRQCGLISDPHWGDASLVFPFAVYEAKGWSGDAREARRQACLAAKVYLDMLDDLGRKPGKTGKGNSHYQTDQSQNSQVFVYTCFGAYWHILVGYKRPRLQREHAGCEGVSKSVYVFQRIWSSRTITERSAWELLSLVDQIHSWGVTDFRDFVIQHLRPWHDFVKRCQINDVKFAEHETNGGKKNVDGKLKFMMPISILRLPGWTKHVKDDARLRFQERAAYHLQEAWTKYRGDTAKEYPLIVACTSDGCGSPYDPGYPLTSIEECIVHLREVHGADDASIAKWAHAWETRDLRSSPSLPLGDTILAGDLVTSKDSRKRGPVETIDGIKVFKKNRR